ncbi:MAG TPA: hypothetical protein VFO79_06750 [Xanthomonadales bacterium]|nr:hypothetical protein [Xanthomonadales bacterium]
MKTAIALALSLLVAGAAGAARVDADPYVRSVDGVSIHLGVVPTETPRDARRWAVAMPGVPAGGLGAKHVTVALYDDRDGSRISDARVVAYLVDVGRSRTERVLLPTAIAGYTTFGNYFSMPGAGSYRIRVEVRTPGHPTPRSATFDYSTR